LSRRRLRLHPDDHIYAAYPDGIGDFVAAQTAAFVEDFGLDGILLGNKFGLLGFWHSDLPVAL